MMSEAFEFISSRLKEKYYKLNHSSGLTIYVFPKKLTTFYALMGTRYGSINNIFTSSESGEKIKVPNGIAHFLEHKLFTNEDGSDSFQQFSQYGADVNAYTSFDKTVYLFSTTDNFDECLAELVGFVTHPYFTEESVQKEQGIIAQEIKMYDDNPYNRCFFGMLEAMYVENPVRVNICGTVKSISQITDKTLYECYNNFYRLSNMAMVVCGDVTPERVLDIVDKSLPKKTGKGDIVPEFPQEPRNINFPYFETKMQVPKPVFSIGIKDNDISPRAVDRQKKDIAMTILNEMLFSRAGELYNSMYESGLISAEFSYGYSITKNFAFNSISGESAEPQKVMEIIKDHIKKKRREGLSKEDFLRNKRVVYAEFIKNFDSTDDIANMLLSFAFEDSEIFEYVDIIDSITFEDVEKLLEDNFNDEYYVLSVIQPNDNN